ncbi:MAG TPA: hypothetical protein VF584_24860 [Longimicrobium sp.]
MIRSLLLLLLALAAAPSVHAQGATRTEPSNSGGLRAAYDPRLLAPAEAHAPLASAAPIEAALTPPASARGSYWKAGAIVGGVLGGVVGGAGGFALDNIERAHPRAGELTFLGAAGGALAGALLGAGIGALIGK